MIAPLFLLQIMNMKTCVVALIFAFMFLSSKADPLFVNGYILLPNGDTLRGQIKFGGSKAATNSEDVTFLDLAGVEKKYKGKKGEVKGYGYETIGIKKDFIFFELKQKADSKFFQRIKKGSRYNIYATSVTGSFGTVDVSEAWYVVEKPSGEFTHLQTCGICPWRKNLTDFLTGDPEALAPLETLKAKELQAYLIKISR
jgi:hypothetical protein